MYAEIEIEKLKPSENNVRSQTVQDDGYIDLLATNIQQYGILHPISVLDLNDGTYEIVAGLRRVKAMQKLGWKTVPCFVLSNTNDAFCLSFSENMQRNNMLKRDICRAIERYLQMHHNDIAEVARIMQLTTPTVKRYAMLAHLPDEVLYRLDAQDGTRMTMQDAEVMLRHLTAPPPTSAAAVATDVAAVASDGTAAPPLHGANATAAEGEPDEAAPPKKERKKPLKSEPWIYSPDDTPTAIPAHLHGQVWNLVERHLEK